mmetsp:Transcript_23167/g.72331  ORF Transcript_23167/g.72331 Transcript_23167/m.72331 type:complete len:421 (-) Transcript_23167:4411-5673(-)
MKSASSIDSFSPKPISFQSLVSSPHFLFGSSKTLSPSSPTATTRAGLGLAALAGLGLAARGFLGAACLAFLLAAFSGGRISPPCRCGVAPPACALLGERLRLLFFFCLTSITTPSSPITDLRLGRGTTRPTPWMRARFWATSASACFCCSRRSAISPRFEGLVFFFCAHLSSASSNLLITRGSARGSTAHTAPTAWRPARSCVDPRAWKRASLPSNSQPLELTEAPAELLALQFASWPGAAWTPAHGNERASRATRSPWSSRKPPPSCWPCNSRPNARRGAPRPPGARPAWPCEQHAKDAPSFPKLSPPSLSRVQFPAEGLATTYAAPREGRLARAEGVITCRKVSVRRRRDIIFLRGTTGYSPRVVWSGVTCVCKGGHVCVPCDARAAEGQGGLCLGEGGAVGFPTHHVTDYKPSAWRE